MSAGIPEPGGAVGYQPRPAWHRRIMAGNAGPVIIVILAIVAIWYVGAFFLNAPFQRDLDERAGRTPSFSELVGETMTQKKPTLPAPHQVAADLYQSVFVAKPWKPSSLVYHGWVTLSSTLLGFAMGTVLGIVIAVAIVHARSLDKSLMPWIITSQTIPILAIAPMVIVVLASIGLKGLVPKALISTYLSFFPVTVGMVKGFRSPDPILLDLMRTYSASRAQVFFKLRVPASMPFLFTSMKVAIATSLVGAIVGELPTGAVAGIGRGPALRLLLQPDGPDVVGADRRLGDGGGAGHHRRPRRPPRAAADGHAMNRHPSQILYPAASIAIVALVLLVSVDGPAVMGSSLGVVAAFLAVGGLIALWRPRWQLLLTGITAHAAAIFLIRALPEIAGHAGPWLLGGGRRGVADGLGLRAVALRPSAGQPVGPARW